MSTPLFVLDEDLLELRAAFRRFATEHKGAADAALWQGLLDLGCIDAMDPAGGDGLRTLLMLQSELGRVHAALPLAGTFWALHLQRGASGPQRRSATAFDAAEPEWRRHTALACAYSMRALPKGALEAQHGFGAVGFMEEHDMPRWFRRIQADCVRHGGVDRALEQVAAGSIDGTSAGSLPDLSLCESLESFRREVREWLHGAWSPRQRAQDQERDRSARQFDRGFLAAIGSRGWIGLSIPREFGGGGLGALEQFVFDEEMSAAEAPIYSYATAQVLAPSLLRFGTEAQRRKFLPLMLGGEAVFCLGYSEPNAGSDLAALKTRAERDSEGWVIDGAKIWTSLGLVADYVWLAARTCRDKPRQAGISVFIVPMSTPGITIRPLEAMNGQRPCAVFYDAVRVPEDALIGQVDGGWQVITAALAQERMLMGGFAAKLQLQLQLGELGRELTVQRDRHGPLRQRADVRQRFASLAAEVQAARLLALQATAVAAQSRTPLVEAALSKIFSSELEERLAQTAFEILGVEATYGEGAPARLAGGRFAHAMSMGLMHVIGGGSNDIQRNLVGQRIAGSVRERPKKL